MSIGLIAYSILDGHATKEDETCTAVIKLSLQSGAGRTERLNVTPWSRMTRLCLRHKPRCSVYLLALSKVGAERASSCHPSCHAITPTKQHDARAMGSAKAESAKLHIFKGTLVTIAAVVIPL